MNGRSTSQAAVEGARTRPAVVGRVDPVVVGLRLWARDPASPGLFAAVCVAICVIDRDVAACSQVLVAKE